MKRRYAQTIRKGQRRERATELAILAHARRNADPVYVIGAAGYWLNQWRRKAA